MASNNGLALQFCNSFSVADLQRRPTAVAAIPERNLLVVGSPGHLATYDAVNSVRHAQFVIPKNHTPRLLHVLPSKADIVVVCLEWTVYVQPLRPAKSTTVMDLSGVKKKPLTDPLLTSMPASSGAGRLPVLFVAAALKDSVRSMYLLPQTGDKGKVTKELQPGFKLQLEKGKGIVALASHPFAPVLTVLTVNGELQLYQHTQGSQNLTPIVQYTMLLEESKTPSPLVIGAHLSEVPCPRVPNTAMIFIFLPRLSLFYIMTHSAGAQPAPFMRIPWLGCSQVLNVEVAPSLNALIAVAGNAADGKYRMRAWTILGDEGCSLDGLKLQPRNCSQDINHLEAAADAGVVSKRPDWAKLWSGNAPLPAASMQGSVLDLTSVVYPDKPATAAGVVPHRAFVMAASNLLIIRYTPRNAQSNMNFCPVAAFRFVDLDHPTQHHPAALAGALHTSPVEWRVQEIDEDPVLTLPHAVPFLNERAACLFSPASQDTRMVEMLPPKDGSGRWLSPDHMAYSRQQHVGFVFCSLTQDATQRAFTMVDFGAAPNPEVQINTKLFFQGVMGTFLGATDSYFLVLESTKIGADNFAVYTVSTEFSEESLVGYTYVHLDTGDSAATLWPGPPASQFLEEAEYDAEGNLVEKDVEYGLGLALVGTAQGGLQLILVPDVSETPADADLLQCSVQCEMQLLDSERIAQVAWNTMVHRQQVGYASHCLGAILTSQRVVITNGALSMLQSIAVAEPNAAVPHIITSLLWVGPALLMSHASGRIEHVMLNGKRTHVCSLARIGSYVLSSATADSLILLHSRGPAWLMTSRKVLLGSLIMQTWLCMLTEGHAYGTWPNVRLELQSLVKHFNVQPASDVPLSEALMVSGCGDMLRQCTQFVNAANVSAVALAAASSDWEHATNQVIEEYERSAYAPFAPPETSQLRQALITVSLGAMSQGKWYCAERCLKASGETLLLMLLHALQHNRAALQQAVRGSGTSSPMHTLAMLLLAADARIGLRQPLQKDWNMSRPVQDTDASTWTYSQDLIPAMKAAADRSLRTDVAVQPGEEGPIPAIHEGGLASHLGLTHAEIIQNATVVASIATTTALSKPLTEVTGGGEEETKKLTPEEEEAERVRDKFLDQFEGDSMFMDSTELAQRAAGDDDSGLISLGDDDDEDDAGNVGDLHARNMKRAQRRQKATEAGLEELAAAQVANEAKKREALGPEGSVPMGIVKKEKEAAAGKTPEVRDVWSELGLIKPAQSLDVDAEQQQPEEPEDDDPFAAFGDMALPEQTAAPAAAGADALGAPPAPDTASPDGAQAAAQVPAVDGTAAGGAAAGGETGTSAAPGMADPAAAETGAGAPANAVEHQATLDVNAGQTPGFLMGVHFMFAGQWNESLQSFAQAYQSSSGLERAQVGQYIAAVSILQGYAMASDEEAGRLSRFAAAMPLLLTDHASFLVNDAVGRNMRLGNYTWAARRLEQFMAACQAKGQHAVAQGAAGMLQQARAMGASNRTVATDENTDTFVQRVDAAEGGQQIYGLCTSLRSGLL